MILLVTDRPDSVELPAIGVPLRLSREARPAARVTGITQERSTGVMPGTSASYPANHPEHASNNRGPRVWPRRTWGAALGRTAPTGRILAARGAGLAGDLPRGRRPRWVHGRVRAGPPLAVAGERAHRRAGARARGAADRPHPPTGHPDGGRARCSPGTPARSSAGVGSARSAIGALRGPGRAQPDVLTTPCIGAALFPQVLRRADVGAPRPAGRAGRAELAGRRTPIPGRRHGDGRAARSWTRSPRPACASACCGGSRSEGRREPPATSSPARTARSRSTAGALPAARVPRARRRGFRGAAPADAARGARPAAGDGGHAPDAHVAGPRRGGGRGAQRGGAGARSTRPGWSCSTSTTRSSRAWWRRTGTTCCSTPTPAAGCTAP